MAIEKNNKIVALEINQFSGTNFGAQNLIYASEIAGLYGGSDSIVRGALIKAEHFLSLGLPGSGGLNGTYAGLPFKDAKEAGYLGYDKDNNILYLYKTGTNTINFSSLGNLGSNVDIFMIGGGGAGNKDGLGGSGGFYTTLSSHTLEIATNYDLAIGKGGIDNGAKGGETAAFSKSVNGGEGGKAHDLRGYYRNYTTSNWVTYSTSTSGSEEVDGVHYPKWSSQAQVDAGTTIRLDCDKNGTLDKVSVYKSGSIISCYRGYYGGLYQLGGGDFGDVIQDLVLATHPTNEAPSITVFNTILVGGPGSDTGAANATRAGQGGGGTNVCGGTSFGSGADGLIIITNHR